MHVTIVQLSKDSSQAASVHDKLTDAVEKYVSANKKLKALQEIEKKQNKKISELEVCTLHMYVLYTKLFV